MLDDRLGPRLIDVADLKSCVAVEEDGTCEGRYNDARLVRNHMGAVVSNDIGADPPADTASQGLSPPKLSSR